MSEHTPGPWVVKRCYRGYPQRIHAPKGDDTQPGLVGKDVTRWGAISLPSSNEGEANARLIAAAPDLLGALEALECADRAPTAARAMAYDIAMRKARAAIAKARGGDE